jgi:hypothetical protein
MHRFPFPGRPALWMALFLLAVSATVPLAAQKSAKEAEAFKPDPAKLDKVMDVTAQHKILDQLAGSWKGDIKVYLHGTPAVEVKATDDNRTQWTLADTWLQSDTHLKLPGSPDMTWRMLMSYNPAFKHYVRITLAAGDPRETVSTGTYDATTKTFTFVGRERSAVTGDDFKRREVIKILGPGKYSWEIWYGFADGSELRAFTGIYTRLKKGK